MGLEPIPWRALSLLAWGVICIVAYGLVLLRRYRADHRSTREVIGTLALFLASVGAGAGTLFWLFWPDVPQGRAFGFGLSMASFAAAGVVLASEPNGARDAR